MQITKTFNPLAKKYNFASLLKFAMPNIIMMIFLSIYSVVDGIFISAFIGTTALSAVNMVFPMFSLSMAISIMISTGGSAIIARKLGAKDVSRAKSDFTFLILVEIIVSIVLAIVSMIFIDEIVDLLGASELQHQMSRDYLFVILAFTPFFFLQTAFQNFFITAGKPGLGLLLTVIAGLTNIVLDYIFIVPLQMGVSGAALATGIGCCIPAIVGMIYFWVNKSGELHFSKPVLDFKMLLKACGNGSSEMVTNLANAVTTLLFNMLFMKYYGEDGVAAITIVLYFQFVFTAIYFGYSSGIAPVISYKYGADDKNQLKSIYKISLFFIIISSIILYILSITTINSMLHLFTERGTTVYAIAKYGFFIYSISFLLMGISIFASALFTSFSDGLVSAVISFARTFIFVVCSILILPIFLGELGLWISVPIAEFLGVIVSVFFLIKKRKKYNY